MLHEDGYIELRDRSKDIIISGGENISTIEVEGVIIEHPAVANAAVVAKPDEKWGETPCAFVMLKPGATATAEEIVAHCRANLASFKCPRYVVFRDLPHDVDGQGAEIACCANGPRRSEPLRRAPSRRHNPPAIFAR